MGGGCTLFWHKTRTLATKIESLGHVVVLDSQISLARHVSAILSRSTCLYTTRSAFSYSTYRCLESAPPVSHITRHRQHTASFSPSLTPSTAYYCQLGCTVSVVGGL